MTRFVVAALLVVALLELPAAPRFTTQKLYGAHSLVPPPHEEVFPTPDGQLEWSFVDKEHGNVTFLSDGLDQVQTTEESTASCGSIKCARLTFAPGGGWGRTIGW